MIPVQLRPYQETVIHEVQSLIKQGYTSILIVMPCRSGKTPVMIAIAQKILSKGCRVLINAHRSVLIEQLVKQCKTYDIPRGAISPHYKENNELCQIGSILTVYNRKDSLPHFPAILSDEAHRDMGFTRKEIFSHYSTSIKIGVTATPCRLSRENLGDIYQVMVLGPTVHELIQQGYLCDFTIFSPPSLLDLSNVDIVAGEYNQSQLGKASNKKHIIGDAITHYKRICPESQMVVFAVSIQHAIAISEEYNLAGIKAGVLHSKLSAKEINGTIAAFVNKDLRVICNVDMITEGFDCPGIEAVQILRKTNSLALHIQMCTRGMTIDKNNPKKVSYILDHVGNSEEHGSMDEDFHWSLEKNDSPNKERATSASNNKTCSECFHYYKAYLPACPICGNQSIKPFQQMKMINVELQIVKSLNKKIRDLVGKNEVQNVGIEDLKNRLQLLIANDIPENHKEVVKVSRHIELLRARDIESLCAFANKWGYDKFWIIRRYSYINRWVNNVQIKTMVENFLNKT